ncbi:hypothetical protein [Streptomyces tanashiensis]|uniref:hypothetical protein n=1 Tax=Streptomyces tanashiensis TaxID=67367 RepID=UPI0033D035BC
MIDSTTPLQATDPAETRAERRRLVESVGAHRRLLAARRPFELADRRRLNREAGERTRAQARHGKVLQRVHEKRTRKERSLAAQLDGLDGKRAGQERRALAVLRRASIDATAVELLRLWIPRRRWRTADDMPSGTGFLASGVFLGLVAASMFADPLYADEGAPWALAVVSALLVVAGAARRAGASR